MAQSRDIAIIGAGAAGLAAAIFAAESRPAAPAGSIVLLDGAARIGAKILVSGGGRCNITHEHAAPADFNAPNHVIRQVLAAFSERDAACWFESLGVPLKREPTGKLFPVSDSARTVLDALLRRCETLGVDILTSHRVTDIAAGEGFTITHQHGSLNAGCVILATGGRSLPRTGSDGFGYELAKRLGHSVTATHPALTPLVLDNRFFHAALSGLSVEATLCTFAMGKLIDRRRGSMLFTHFGVSGPIAMDASRFWVIARAEGREPTLRCCLLNEPDFAAAEKWLLADPRRTVRGVLAERLPVRLVEVLLHHVMIDAATGIHQLPREARRRLVRALTELDLPVLGPRGWNYAEVTAGGVPLKEVDHRTMASRRTRGLYLIGEVLDCDGRIGGFNFQWAWSTGYLAGRAAAKAVGE